MRSRRWNLDDSLADAGNTCILRHEISVPDGGWELVARSIVIRSLEAVGEKCFRNRKGLNLEDSCTLAFGNLIRPHHGRLIWPPHNKDAFPLLAENPAVVQPRTKPGWSAEEGTAPLSLASSMQKKSLTLLRFAGQLNF